MDNQELLDIFGYTDTSEITAEGFFTRPILTSTSTVFKLLNITTFKIRFGVKFWGQVHHQVHFSILKDLLQDGGDVINISYDPTTSTLTVHVDRTKILSHGKPALGRYLCRLHIWHCTADDSSCKQFY